MRWRAKPKKQDGKTPYERKLKLGIFLYSLFALLLIPLYTVNLASHANVLDYSISFIGNNLGHRQSLIVWTVMSGVFFICFICYLLVLTKNTKSSAKWMIYLASGMLIVCNFIPFLPEQFPRLARYHNFFAMASSLLLALTLFVFVLALRKFDRRIFWKAMWLLLAVVAVSGVLMLLFGVNSLLETVSILSVCLFMFCVLFWLLRSDRFDGVQVLLEVDADRAVEEARRLVKKAEKAKEEAAEAAYLARKARMNARKLCRQAGIRPSQMSETDRLILEEEPEKEQSR